jgi:hypothetical protein
LRSAQQGAAQFGAAISGVSQLVTPEQKARGLAGEAEIKRRLRLPGGWGGLTFLRDATGDGCGYDFEAAQGDRTVRLEVKTFSADGRVHVTNRELQAAAEYKGDYYLVGVHDSDAIPPNQWSSFATNVSR